jgi:hypothetical protein
LAEIVAWDFVNDLKAKNEKTFELVTINPGLVIGPNINEC